jgi:GWxTD domain-containing protein
VPARRVKRVSLARAAACASLTRKVLAHDRRSLLPLLWLTVAVLLAAPHALAAVPDRPPLRSLQPPYFSVDLAVAVDSTSHARIRVVVSVPYPELNWQQEDSALTAGAGFVVELVPSKGRKRLYGDAWEQRLMVRDYATTAAHRNQLVVVREFAVPPATYSARVSVRDLRALETAEVKERIEVRDLARLPVGFADLELGVVDSTGSFTANPSRSFGYDSGELAVRTVMVDRRPGSWPRRYHYHWRVQDPSGGVTAQGDTVVAVERSAQPVLLRPTRQDLFIGDYSIEVEMREGKTSWRTQRSFEVEESGPPRGREFDELLEALAYIAEGSEVDPMRGLSPELQAERWEAFWRRRDPTPETVRNEYQIEFFRRLRYASQHFLGFGPGWRSDMGRAYIRYGPPDQVEQRQATGTTPGLEIWYYNQPYRRLVFGDREGFGRFSLLNPTND